MLDIAIITEMYNIQYFNIEMSRANYFILV